MSDTAVQNIAELDHLEYLGMLEELDLTGAPISKPSASAAEASCLRIHAIQKLLPRNGKTKLSVLNNIMVVAEERVSSLNYYDSNHLQYMDTKRDDAQDTPPEMFQ